MELTELSEGEASAAMERLELLVEARRASGFSLDFWSDFTDEINIEALRILVGRAHLLRRGKKSSG